MTKVFQAIGEVQDEVYCSPVWHDMARSVGTSSRAATGLHITGKAAISPGTYEGHQAKVFEAGPTW